jgi:hypothetical protein
LTVMNRCFSEQNSDYVTLIQDSDFRCTNDMGLRKKLRRMHVFEPKIV